MTNISSEMNLKFVECWEISEIDLLKLCQKLENLVKTVVSNRFASYSKVHLLSISYNSNTLEL